MIFLIWPLVAINLDKFVQYSILPDCGHSFVDYPQSPIHLGKIVLQKLTNVAIASRYFLIEQIQVWRPKSKANWISNGRENISWYCMYISPEVTQFYIWQRFHTHRIAKSLKDVDHFKSLFILELHVNITQQKYLRKKHGHLRWLWWIEIKS